MSNTITLAASGIENATIGFGQFKHSDTPDNTMSIPTTETKPDGLHSLPPKQRRSLRKVIESASSRDIKDILREIARHAIPTGQYYWQLLACLLLLVTGSLLRSNLIKMAGIVVLPLAKPLLSLIYGGALPSGRHIWKALIGIAATLIGFYVAGWVVRGSAPLQAEGILSGADLTSPSEGVVLWVVLAITAAFMSYWFTFHETFAHLASILLGYLVLMPFMAAGQTSLHSFTESSLPLLITGFTRLGLALLVIFLTTWVLGFPPRGSLGVVISIVVIAGGAVSLVEMVRGEIINYETLNPEPTPFYVYTPTSLPTTPATPAPTITATYTRVPSQTPEPSPTTQPTATTQPYTKARVTSENGLVVREAPSTSAYILTYVNKGDVVELTGNQETNQGILWEQIVAPNGVIGWVSGYYIILINP